jgi:NADH-quinone oxidoreductase subunit L
MGEAADWLDRWVIGGLLVRGLHGLTELTGRGLRMVQTGDVQTYAMLLVLGAVLLLLAMIGR